MSLLDVLLSIREQLIQYAAENNRKDAEDVFITLSTLREISYRNPNRSLTGILVDLASVAQDIVMGESWKSTIPSVDDIRTVFASIDEAS